VHPPARRAGREAEAYREADEEREALPVEPVGEVHANGTAAVVESFADRRSRL
jgi:hypothetical protein